MLIDSGDRSGRLLRYDTCSKVLTVLQRGLAFPNGVTLNKDKSFLPVAESNSMKILKFWIQGERVTFSPQPFAQLSKFPGNIEVECKGNFRVALDTKRRNIERDLVAVKLDGNGNIVKVLEGNERNAFDFVSEVEEHDGYLSAGSPIAAFRCCNQGLAKLVYLLCIDYLSFSHFDNTAIFI